MSLTVLAIILFLSSFVVSVILTAVVRKFSLRAGFAAHPSADRYHDRVVPLGGGIAIFITLVGFILSAVVLVRFFLAPGQLDWLGESISIYTAGFIEKTNQLIIVLICITVLFLLGLWDDRRRLGPGFKLLVQFAVAIAAAVFVEIRVEFFIENTLITSIISAFWIVLIINAMNFLDNMDGAAAGIAIIVGSILLTAAALSGQVFVGGFALVFIGALSGFLLFNFPPAEIFMGDAGSLVVGFVLALLTLRTTYYHEAQSGQWYPVFLPVVCMAVPLYDFISVTLLRLSQGKSPFIGDTQHFSHRLKKRGLSDTQTVLTLYLATLCTGLGAIFLYQVNIIGAFLIFIQTFMVLAIIAVLEAASANERNPV